MKIGTNVRILRFAENNSHSFKNNRRELNWHRVGQIGKIVSKINDFSAEVQFADGEIEEVETMFLYAIKD